MKRTRVDCLGGVLGVLNGALDCADFGVKDTAGRDEEGGVEATTGGEVDWCRLPLAEIQALEQTGLHWTSAKVLACERVTHKWDGLKVTESKRRR